MMQATQHGAARQARTHHGRRRQPLRGTPVVLALGPKPAPGLVRVLGLAGMLGLAAAGPAAAADGVPIPQQSYVGAAVIAVGRVQMTARVYQQHDHVRLEAQQNGTQHVVILNGTSGRAHVVSASPKRGRDGLGPVTLTLDQLPLNPTPTGLSAIAVRRRDLVAAAAPGVAPGQALLPVLAGGTAIAGAAATDATLTGRPARRAAAQVLPTPSTDVTGTTVDLSGETAAGTHFQGRAQFTQDGILRNLSGTLQDHRTSATFVYMVTAIDRRPLPAYLFDPPPGAPLAAASTHDTPGLSQVLDVLGAVTAR